ncbi:hypothetical protein Ae201684P_009493 [Aphanomyces euteiches]|uniref:Retrotransposon gag domain-containing protein n=1 Tax=Aphanomyces euteiches TaxID=100861 RepID=A0A6G0W2A6_9STRA|nr:hypothetical protein Ae201684_019232 [Aphanomyces euteiches]KAH9096258.1 hypothetical protein Ae201684P_009493 [Aphanomyces euteiches]
MQWLLQVTIAADALCILKECIKVAFAMSHLKGRAEAWAYSLRMGNPNCFPTLGDFASQLKTAFLPPNSDFRNRSRFLNAAQGKQTIREFVHELRYLYASMNDERSLPESTRVTVFMNGLNKGPARTELFRRYPETFDEAVSIALSEDFSQNLARASASDSMDMDISSMGQIPQRYQAGQPSPDKRCYGSVAEQPRVLITLPTRVGQFVSDETYFVIDLDERWDLILGMGWLEKHQPTINWKLKTISKSLDANKALGLVSNEPTPIETKSPRRVTLAVEGLATHGHDIALMKAADGQRIASADEDCDGTGDTMTSEDHVDIWGVECDLEKALRDGRAGGALGLGMTRRRRRTPLCPGKRSEQAIWKRRTIRALGLEPTPKERRTWMRPGN